MNEEFIGQLKIGDHQALKDVYGLFYDRVFQATFFVIREFDLAEDIVHDVFLKALDRVEQVREPAKLGNWLCRIAINEARSMLRYRCKCVPLSERGEHNDEQPLSPEQSLLEKEEREAMKRLILQLKPNYRQVVYLKYFEDMSLAEIGTVLEIPVSTVKTRLFYARQQIRKMLKPERYPKRLIIK